LDGSAHQFSQGFCDGKSKSGSTKSAGNGPTVGLYKSWEKVRQSLNLQGVRLHDLRHSFASFAAARGASLYVIGKALGHTQASTTQRYAHLSDDPVRRAAETVADQILGTRVG